MASENILTLEDGSFEADVLKSDVPVLVDFWAPWCQPCRAIAPSVEALAAQYAGKVKQLITGSTGLDDAEWGVTLFAHDTFQIKSIVYQMRFDPVSADYGDFGEFFIGVQLPLDELFRRLQL